MSELRQELAEELRPWLGEVPLRSPRNLQGADLVACGGPCELPAPHLAEASHRQGLWNFRWTPVALHRLLGWQPPRPAPAPPPALSAAGNLGTVRAHLVAACLGRLGQSQGRPLAPASGPYVDPFILVATPPGQPLVCHRLGQGSPLERALGRFRRLPARSFTPPLEELEGLSPAERELLVRLEQLPSMGAAGPHRLAAYAQDLARRMDAFYASSRLFECARELAVFQAAGRGLQVAAELLGVSQEGESLCL